MTFFLPQPHPPDRLTGVALITLLFVIFFPPLNLTYYYSTLSSAIGMGRAHEIAALIMCNAK